MLPLLQWDNDGCGGHAICCRQMKLRGLVIFTLGLTCIFPLRASDPLIAWTTDAVILDPGFSSWARMVQLADGSWLAAYTLTANPTVIRVKRSFDSMRTWTWITDVSETNRNLDNANLGMRADGVILLAVRSISSITNGSYYIEIYESMDSGNSFQYLSQVDWDHGTGGVFEPFLWVQPDGEIFCFYASETHRLETPAYAQTLSEKVSSDGGQIWGPEILAIAQAGGARAGEGNIVRISGSVLALFFEMCGTENCIGNVTYSSDGVTWPAISQPLPDTFEDVQAVRMQNGLIFATSNIPRIIVSADVGNTWTRVPQWPFIYGSWPALYQTSPNEIAMVVTGGGDQGQAGEYIKFGTVNLDALSTLIPVTTCMPPTLGMPQNCH